VLNQGANPISIGSSGEVDVDKVILIGVGELCDSGTSEPVGNGENCKNAPTLTTSSGSDTKVYPTILSSVSPESVETVEYRINNQVVQSSSNLEGFDTSLVGGGVYELETRVILNDGSEIVNTSKIDIPTGATGGARNGAQLLIATVIGVAIVMLVIAIVKFRKSHSNLLLYNSAGTLVKLKDIYSELPHPKRIFSLFGMFHRTKYHTAHKRYYFFSLTLLASACIGSTALSQSATSTRRVIFFEPENHSPTQLVSQKSRGSDRFISFKRAQVNNSGTTGSSGGTGGVGGGSVTNPPPPPVPNCPKSGIGGVAGCKRICPAGHIGAYPTCAEQQYTSTLNGINYSYTNGKTLKGTAQNPVVYDGVHFTGEVLLTDAEHIIFRNCKFSKSVLLFGASKNITIQNCIARGSHDYATGRWLYISPITKYWGGAGKDNARTATGLVIKEVLVEHYSNDAIENNGGEGVVLEDFVIRDLWAGGQGVGDVKKCTDNPSATVFNQANLALSCAPDPQAFDPHVDGVKVHNGSITVKNGLFENISYQAVIGQRLADRDWRPVTITIDNVRMNNIGFRHTAAQCSAWQGAMRYKVCGASGGGTGVRANDQVGAPNTNGPVVTISALQQSNLSTGIWISSPSVKWSMTGSSVTWIRLTPRSSEGNGPPPITFTNNTRTDSRSDGYWR
jgi:hypothetical protein